MLSVFNVLKRAQLQKDSCVFLRKCSGLGGLIIA